MKKNFVFQDQQAQVQDSQRLLMTMLTTNIQSAGYFIDPMNKTRADALPASGTGNPNPDGTRFSVAQGIVGTSPAASSAGASDTFNVRYQTTSGDGVMNCLGGSNPSGAAGPAIWVNSFAVNANNELTCAVNGGAAVALVSNVAQINLLYGVDTAGNGNTDTYRAASAITSANLWNSVRSVKLIVKFANLMDSSSNTTVVLPQPWIQTISLMNNS